MTQTRILQLSDMYSRSAQRRKAVTTALGIVALAAVLLFGWWVWNYGGATLRLAGV